MSTTWSVSEAVKRLGCRDATLTEILLSSLKYRDAQLAELVDCLLAHPDAVAHVNLAGNQLTDKTGVKLARYLTASSTIVSLALNLNKFGEATYLALAAALRVNTSLRDLYLFDNLAVDSKRIDAALVQALRLNPDRPARSTWMLYGYGWYEFELLKIQADQLGHPSMLQLLALVC